MSDLIARLVAATEATSELNGLLAKEFGGSTEWWCSTEGEITALPSCPNFSGSIDDALELVPEGWQWEVRQIPTDEGINHSAQVNWEPDGRCYAASPALALCIAALRARDTAE